MSALGPHTHALMTTRQAILALAPWPILAGVFVVAIRAYRRRT